jgi:DNA-binding response OmpR family regulator
MIRFNRELLERARKVVPSTSPPSRRLPVERDLEMISSHLARYERRIQYWIARHWELEGLSLESESRELGHGGRSIKLTKRELQLMSTLVNWSPEFLTARQLLAEAWHDSALPEETLRTYIVRLRSKLGELQLDADIVNRPRQGYALIFHDGGQRRPVSAFT